LKEPIVQNIVNNFDTTRKDDLMKKLSKEKIEALNQNPPQQQNPSVIVGSNGRPFISPQDNNS